MAKDIVIKGAKENNLKGIDVTIPRDKLVVLTGLSGSGKSSLAFDTIYAEGQRKYMESLSSYARQFLGQMEKPNVDYIEGLSPAISIDQKTTNKNPRSTVGTVTEIYDYLRLMYARIGIPHCPVCGREITSQSIDQITELLMNEGEGTKLTILAPVIRRRKGQHEKILERIQKEGFTRVRVDGEMKLLDSDEIKLEKTFKHTIEIVVDRVKVKDGVQSRLAEACELAIAHGEGLVQVIIEKSDVFEKTFSTSLACPEHGVSIEELEPRMFSFNNPMGACPECNGLGFIQSIDPELVIPDQSLSIIDKALGNIFATMEYTSYYWQVIKALADMYEIDLNTPYNKLPKKFRDVLLYELPHTFVNDIYYRTNETKQGWSLDVRVETIGASDGYTLETAIYTPAKKLLAKAQTAADAVSTLQFTGLKVKTWNPEIPTCSPIPIWTPSISRIGRNTRTSFRCTQKNTASLCTHNVKGNDSLCRSLFACLKSAHWHTM